MREHGKSPVNIIKADQEKNSDVWTLPDVQKKDESQNTGKTNALGKSVGWVYEPPRRRNFGPYTSYR